MATSVKECCVCAWRGTCTVKFRYESNAQNCVEFSRDITLATKQKEEEDKPEIKKDPSMQK